MSKGFLNKTPKKKKVQAETKKDDFAKCSKGFFLSKEEKAKKKKVSAKKTKAKDVQQETNTARQSASEVFTYL